MNNPFAPPLRADLRSRLHRAAESGDPEQLWRAYHDARSARGQSESARAELLFLTKTNSLAADLADKMGEAMKVRIDVDSWREIEREAAAAHSSLAFWPKKEAELCELVAASSQNLVTGLRLRKAQLIAKSASTAATLALRSTPEQARPWVNLYNLVRALFGRLAGLHLPDLTPPTTPVPLPPPVIETARRILEQAAEKKAAPAVIVAPTPAAAAAPAPAPAPLPPPAPSMPAPRILPLRLPARRVPLLGTPTEEQLGRLAGLGDPLGRELLAAYGVEVAHV